MRMIAHSRTPKDYKTKPTNIMPKYTQGQGSARPDYMPEGKYEFAVIGASDKVSGNGNEMIELKCEVIGPEVEEGQGAIFFENLVFTDSAFFKIDQFLSSTGDAVEEGEEVDVEAADQIGKSGVCSLIVETYKGKQRNKVAKFLAPDEGAAVAAEEEEAF